MSYKIQELIKLLDGVAAVNLLEPSQGDIERVVYAYADCRKERDQLRAENEKLEFMMNSIAEERNHLANENERLRAALEIITYPVLDSEGHPVTDAMALDYYERVAAEALDSKLKSGDCEHKRIGDTPASKDYCLDCGEKLFK